MEQAMHERFMQEALLEARKAAELGEVPVGAVVVRGGDIIARGHNRRELDKNALAHAEIEAINDACSKLGGWRLPGCSLYVTLEPCPMCAGALINARIERLYFGASDPKAGSVSSLVSLLDLPYNHKVEWQGGILEGPCASILSEFFRALRRGK